MRPENIRRLSFFSAATVRFKLCATIAIFCRVAALMYAAPNTGGACRRPEMNNGNMSIKTLLSIIGSPRPEILSYARSKDYGY